MHPSLRHLDHRPWPLPEAPWSWRQSWLDLAFIHYRIDPGQLRGRLPPGLELEVFDGSAWIGVVPFRMAGVMRRPWPDLPYLSTFPELNVRTYVTAGGKPGVWFFSLDADSWAIVAGGRSIYGLPYHLARMDHRRVGDEIAFESRRRGRGVRFSARYRPLGDPLQARPGTFEHWAAERYCLYSPRRRGGLRRVEVHHPPWPLRLAKVTIESNDLLSVQGLSVEGSAPVSHFSEGVNVVSYGPRALTTSLPPT